MIQAESNLGLHFKNLSGLVSYLEYLADTQIGKKADFDSSLLKDAHIGKSVLFIDKYQNCSVPSVDLEFIFESQGIFDYEASLDPDFNFKHSICSKDDVISELFVPDIEGDHYNPYIRFKSCVGIGSRTCSKLLDLAGLEILDINQPKMHDNVFLDLVCTFPSEVDFYVFNPVCRAAAGPVISKYGKVHKSRLNITSVNLIDRMNRCREAFFKKLSNLFAVPANNVLGMSSSLHIWSSSIPVLPNCHVHNIIPFFSFDKKPVSIDREALFNSYSDLMAVQSVVTGTRKIARSRFYGSENVKVTQNVEVNLVSKFIVDRELYDQLRLKLSADLAELLHFSQCSWFDRNKPIDIDALKELWSDVVYEEFSDIMDNWVLLDVHVAWIPWYKKSKLLHALQYKSRPPVLDLDLFFKKCPDVVTGYDKVNPDKILDFLSYQLQVAINCSNGPDIDKFESLLRKAELLFDSYDSMDFLQWLQFLSTWVTDTRVFGFWRNIKKFMLDPEHKVLVEQIVCPICNGSIVDTGIKVKFCIVDYVIVRTGSKFIVHNVKGPPLEVLD